MLRTKHRKIPHLFGINSGVIIDKKMNDQLKFINSARFIPDSLSNLVDNLAEQININKSKDCVDQFLKCVEENCKIKYKD